MADGKVIINTTLDTSGFKSGISEIKGGASSAAESIKSIATAIGITALASKAFDTIKSSIDSAFSRLDTMAQFERTMTAITGDTEAAGKSLETLKGITKGTAYGLDTAAKSVQDFVTRGMDISQATEQISIWGDAVAFYGNGTNEQLADVTDALAKMRTKCTVEMDQLNRLFDAGIDAVGMYAQATGSTSAEVQSALSAGSISSADFIDTVSSAMASGTAGVLNITGAAKEAGTSWQGTFDNAKAACTRGMVGIIESIDQALTDNGMPDMKQMVADLGKAFETTSGQISDIVSTVMPPLIDAFKWFSDHGEEIKADVLGIAAAFVTYQTLTGIAGIISAVSAALDGMTIAQAALNFVMSISPIGWIALAVGTLTAAIIYLWNTNEGFRNAVTTAWDAIKAAVAALADAVEWAKQLISDSWSLVCALFTGDTQGAVDAAQRIFDSLPGPVQDIMRGMAETIDNIVTGIKDWFVARFQEMCDAAEAICKFFAEDIPNWFASIPDKLKQIGSDIVNGLKKGVEDAWAGMLSGFQWLIDQLPDCVKKVLGIASPSKVMRKLARHIPEGLGAGIQDTAPQLLRTMSDTMGQLVDTAGNDLNVSTSVSATTDPKSVEDANGTITKSTAGMAVAVTTDTNNLKANLSTTWSAIGQQLSKTNADINTDVTAKTSDMSNKAQVATQALQTGLTGLWNQTAINTTGSAGNMRTGTVAATQSMSTSAQGIVSGMVSGINTSVSPLPSKMSQVGTDSGAGLSNGLIAKKAEIETNADSLVKALLDKFYSGLGIASPSTVFKDIGMYCLEGMINGMPADKVTSWADTVTTKLKEAWSSGSLDLVKLMQTTGDQAMSVLEKIGIGMGGTSPVANWQDLITSYFGYRDDTGGVGSTYHQGIDFGVPTGTQVSAWGSGTVVQSGQNGGYGISITIDHGNGLQSIYGHLSQAIAQVGQTVAAGQLIGLSGNTGWSTGPHLHFGISQNGSYVDPLPYLQGSSSGTSSSSGNLDSWLTTALIATGQYSADNLAKLRTMALSESGGDPYAQNNWDSNAAAGTPSKGLLQVIDSTFNAYKLSGYDNIWDPVSNAIASIRYQLARYGGIVGHAGYAVGSRYITRDQLAYIHKGEAIIPADQNPYVNSGGNMLPELASMLLGQVYSSQRMSVPIAAGSGSIAPAASTKPQVINQTVNILSESDSPAAHSAALKRAAREMRFDR